MSEKFAAIPLSNARILCIGSITRVEAREASSSGLNVDEFGYYLFLASADRPSEPIEILAKFLSSEHAERAADFFPVS